MQNEKKFIDEIRQIFTSLAIRCPFSYPLLTLPIKLSDTLDGIAATDSARIIINPTLWSQLTKSQKLFISLHEWMHIALMHPKRIRTRQPDIFNVASDFVVNSMIQNDFPDFEFPPGKSLLDHRYEGKSAEEVYKDLEQEVRNRKENGQSGNGQPKGNLPGSKKNSGGNFLNREEAIEQLLSGTLKNNDVQPMPPDINESDLVDSIIKAAARHKLISRNPLPGGYEDSVTKLRKSYIPWTRVFARLAKQTLKKASDRNPFKPDPKYLPFDIFIPTEISSGVPKVVLIVDTSGSMDSKEFEYALGHIEKVCAICEKVTIITADAEVQEVVRIKNLKSQIMKKKIAFKGRGGTDMNPAFLKASELRPDLIILYSDLELPWYPPRPKSPVIFLSRQLPRYKPPYGSYIHVEDRDEE